MHFYEIYCHSPRDVHIQNYTIAHRINGTVDMACRLNIGEVCLKTYFEQHKHGNYEAVYGLLLDYDEGGTVPRGKQRKQVVHKNVQYCKT